MFEVTNWYILLSLFCKASGYVHDNRTIYNLNFSFSFVRVPVVLISKTQMLWNYPLIPDDDIMHYYSLSCRPNSLHDDVIKWIHFPPYWPFVRGIHRWPLNSPLKGQWRGALMFSLICAWINSWVNNGEAGDLRCHRAHYGVIVMWIIMVFLPQFPVCYP